MPQSTKQAFPEQPERATAKSSRSPAFGGKTAVGQAGAQLKNLSKTIDASAYMTLQRRVVDAIQIADRVDLPQGLKAGAANPQARQTKRNAPTALGAQDSPVAQRKAGMEVELDVPFYGQVAGADLTDTSFLNAVNRATLSAAERRAIMDFLYGGLEYGDSYGQVAGKYDISADHGSFQTPHLALLNHVTGRHVVAPADIPTMSNMEYRTKEQEERRDRSEARTQDIATRVKNHAQSSAQRAQTGSRAALAAPVGAYFTGIPVGALRKLLHGDAVGLGLLSDMIARLNPTVYIQTTVGALPSEIPTLFNEAAAEIDAGNVGNANIKATTASTVLRSSVTCAQAALAHGNCDALRARLGPGNCSALTGWLALIAQSLLAWQLETTSLRYRRDAGGRPQKPGNTSKNLLPYLSKTQILGTIGALPAAARPQATGAHAAQWMALMGQLLTQCDAGTTDLVTLLGVTDYDGQPFYDGAVVQGTIAHDQVILGENRVEWIAAILQGHADANDHVGPHEDNALGLDAGQQSARLGTGLIVPGQQAIPLEDRLTGLKPNFANRGNIAGLDATLMNAWHGAKGRRMASTTDGPLYLPRRQQVRNKLDAYGNLHTLVPALGVFRARLAALPAVVDHTLRASLPAMVLLDTDIDNWVLANSAAAIAHGFLAPLIGKANWSTKGEALIGTKVPKGVSLMRTELNAGNNAATTLTNLANIATNRLRSGARDAATTHMYELARDTPGWIAGGAAGWNSFVAKYNTTNAAV